MDTSSGFGKPLFAGSSPSHGPATSITSSTIVATAIEQLQSRATDETLHFANLVGAFQNGRRDTESQAYLPRLLRLDGQLDVLIENIIQATTSQSQIEGQPVATSA